MHKKLTKSQEKSICLEYLDGKNTPELSTLYNIAPISVNRCLRRNNIPIRHISESRRKYKFIAENFFDNIDTEAKAYFLGLLFTDGCNYIKKINETHIHHVVLSLKECDKHILETFCSLLYGNSEMLIKRKTKKDYNRQDQYTLRIVSRRISEKLLSYGLTPRKSFTCQFPNISKHLLPAFIRGCWDGDGCIHYNSSTSSFQCSFVGSVQFCNKLNKIIQKNIGITFSEYIHKNYSKPMKTLTIHGNQKCKIFLDWLYRNSNANLQLKRKREKYNSLLRLLESRQLKNSCA